LPKNVADRIIALEQSYKTASDWINQTGSGIDPTDSSFWDAVLKRCEYYYELEPVFGDRAAMCPLATNQDLDVADSDSSGLKNEDEDSGEDEYSTISSNSGGGKKRASLPREEGEPQDDHTLINSNKNALTPALYRPVKRRRKGGS